MLGFHGDEYDLLWILPNGSRGGAVAISAKNQVGEWLKNNETHPGYLSQKHAGKD